MDALILLFLIALGYGAGRWAESKHYTSIREREKKFGSLPVLTRKNFDPSFHESQLFIGSVVVSVDYFKRISAMLRNILGGRVLSYETLLDRGRREAVLRVKEQAALWGAKEVVNLRLETATIGNAANERKALGSVEVYAYGTGLK